MVGTGQSKKGDKSFANSRIRKNVSDEQRDHFIEIFLGTGFATSVLVAELMKRYFALDKREKMKHEQPILQPYDDPRCFPADLLAQQCILIAKQLSFKRNTTPPAHCPTCERTKKSSARHCAHLKASQKLAKSAFV